MKKASHFLYDAFYEKLNFYMMNQCVAESNNAFMYNPESKLCLYNM